MHRLQRHALAAAVAAALLLASHATAQWDVRFTTDKSWYELGETVTMTLLNVDHPTLEIGSHQPTLWLISSDGTEQVIREPVHPYSMGIPSIFPLPVGREETWAWDQKDHHWSYYGEPPWTGGVSDEVIEAARRKMKQAPAGTARRQLELPVDDN